ncbi:MAG: metal-dependent hydrolase [Dehalococcoidales bacterium]|nr:metal-dependent hydrolase [Dehalococcoidales bacterium]
MFLFGHTGITLGVASLWANALRVPPTISGIPKHKTSWFVPLGTRVDIRLLLIGSLLPDIIDKPLGIYIFPEALSNGRIFSHTILFLLVVTMVGIYLYRSRGKTHLLAVSFGVLTHLILDQMWLAPRTLFWPIYGFAFDKYGTTDWIVHILHRVVTYPSDYIPELIGAATLVWFTLALVQKRAVFRFLKYGQIQ